MPYYGYNGESPGNEWVKTSSGWQKLIALRENLHRHIKKIARERFQNVSRQSSFDDGSSSEDGCHDDSNSTDIRVQALSQDIDIIATLQEDVVSVRHEYEIRDKPQASYVQVPRSLGARGNYYTIGEILCKLDFANAVRDHRRFYYVGKLLELIVTTHFSCLSGLAQKNLLYVLEEVLNRVCQTHFNMAQLRRILCGAIVAMDKSRYHHIGCPATWNERMSMLQHWLERLNSIQVKERENDGGMFLTDLPGEILSRILHHLSDPRDVVNAGSSCHQLHMLASRNLLWKNLCRFNFTELQINKVLPVSSHEIDWNGVYKKLYHRHPRHEVFTDMLQICGFCNCLFWMNGGHPCTKELLPEGDNRLTERPELNVNVRLTPQQFLDLFPAPP